MHKTPNALNTREQEKEGREGEVGIGVNFVIKVGGLMASAEREAITGVWGRNPQRGPGAEPLIRGQGAKPP